MKDYLNAEEKNQFMVLLSILQNFNGVRNMGHKSPGEIETLIESWDKRGNLTKEEKRSLKMVKTYLTKFGDSLYNRLSDKDKCEIDRRLQKFDFRLIDDFTLKKVYRQIQTELEKQEEFRLFSEEIMAIRCKDCTKNHKECNLCDMFDNNFIPESGYNLPSCKFAYKELSEKKKEKLKKKYSRMLNSKKAAEFKKKQRVS